MMDRYREMRLRYYRRVELGIAGALAVHAAAFLLAPPYVPRPFQLRSQPLTLLAELPGRGLGVERVRSQETLRTAPVPEGISAWPIRSEQIAPTSAGAGAAPSGELDGVGNAESRGSGADGFAPPVYYAFDTAPKTTRRVEPEYPAAARARGAEGTVVVNANVDERGRVVRAWVVASTAPGVLVEAALDAIYHFEFQPGLSGGAPVKCTVAVPFRFSLKKVTQYNGDK